MPPYLLIAKSAALVLWAAWLSRHERLRPASPRPPHSDGPRLTHNLGLWLSTVALGPLLTAPVALLATQTNLWTRPPFVHNGWMLATDLLVLDLASPS